MPKCTICGKKFDNLAALRDHHRSTHPNTRFVAPKSSLTRNLMVVTVIILVAVGATIGYVVYVQSQQNSTTATISDGVTLGSQISSSLSQNLTGVSYSTLAAVGAQSADSTPPTSITPSPLISGGKTEVLYIGAEFCPYCAAERWSMVVALSKFGNFTGLEYMQSGQSDGNIATVTFVNAIYNSSYITLVTVENEDRNHNLLQSPTTQEQNLWNQYNENYYPFIDIGGQYILKSSQFPYTDLSNMNWTQIGSQLNDPTSAVGKLIDGGANQLIGAICNAIKDNNGTTAPVCGESFATVSYTQSGSSAPAPSFMQIIDETRVLTDL